ncbi:hypothetical protein [Chryseobacterium sp. c4a]|uniref:hypothetical protein n=1 Tax=Chryseobacterium sp. c4a TaxID=1573582 RepID=UPI00135B27DC|nr:hypothetical protein [Chryseobacterium sp. c4a]
MLKPFVIRNEIWNLKSFDEKQNIREHLKMKLLNIAGSKEEYEERFELENAIINIHSLIDVIESKINTLGGFDDSMTIRFKSMLFVEKYLINEYKNPKIIRTSNYNLLINLIKEILSNYNVEYKSDIIKLRDIIMKKYNLLNNNGDR